MFTSDQLLKSHARTSGFKDARPGSRTHIRVQGRTSGFKDATYVISSTHIRVFGPPQYSYFHALKNYFLGNAVSTLLSTRANDAKNTNSSRVPVPSLFPFLFGTSLFQKMNAGSQFSQRTHRMRLSLLAPVSSSGRYNRTTNRPCSQLGKQLQRR